MTKLTSVVWAILLAGSLLTGCTSENTGKQGLSVAATNFALYDLARAVCGDSAEVTMLISPGSESHDFEATLADVAAIASADLFVSVGNEDWVADIFDAIGEEGAGVRRILAMEQCELLAADCDLPHGEGEHDHNGHDHGAEELDEHVWTSIPNAVAILDAIVGEMTAVDPEHADEYRKRGGEYRDRLNVLDEDYRAMIAAAPIHTIVVADRFPFLYLAHEYGLEWHGAFSGCSSNTEPALSTINSLIDIVRHEGIETVFTIEFSDGRTAGAVAYETGCRIVSLQSAHNVTREEFTSGITYYDVMKENLKALETALRGQETETK